MKGLRITIASGRVAYFVFQVLDLVASMEPPDY